jgi:hypothetical protein
VPAIVSDPALVTPDWLTEVLRDGGHLPSGGRVTKVEGRRVGTGQVGQNIIFSVSYEGGSGPASLVAKLPSPDPVSRATGVALRNYEREVRFYQEVAGTVRIRTPRCYHADVDLDSGDFVLLLEDLSPAVPGDQVAGCSVEEAALAMQELARLHGPRWEDPALDSIEWLSRRTPESGQQVQAMYQAVWPGFVERFGGALTTEALALAERFGGSLAAWLSEREGPATVTHGDYRLDNMLYGTAAGGYPLAVVDWQTPGHGPGAADAAYFLGAGLPVEERRAHEDALLRIYHDALQEEGVTDYPWEQCREDYRAYTFSGVLMAVVASMIVGQDERGDAMFTAMATRHLAHAIDLRADELLP